MQILDKKDITQDQAEQAVAAMSNVELRDLVLEINNRANDMREQLKVLERSNTGFNPELENTLNKIRANIDEIFSIDLSGVNDLPDDE